MIQPSGAARILTLRNLLLRISILSICLGGVASGLSLKAQTPATQPVAKSGESGWIWTEQFAGTTNTYGQVTALSSTVGYNFNSHAGVIGGVPVYFIRNSSTASSSASGIGDAFIALQFAWANPIVNYRMTLSGAAPTGESSKGLGVGHASYDWTNHFDRSFGRLTPFVDAGLANAIPQMMFVQREFESYGHAAHFELGPSLHFLGPLHGSISGYDIEPWGTQTLLSRVVKNGGPPVGTGKNGRAFELAQTTTGTSALTRDRGLNIGAGLSFDRVELWTGFSHSNLFDLNTVSFGLGVNLSSLLRHLAE
jgi:hypothetical protein